MPSIWMLSDLCPDPSACLVGSLISPGRRGSAFLFGGPDPAFLSINTGAQDKAATSRPVDEASQPALSFLNLTTVCKRGWAEVWIWVWVCCRPWLPKSSDEPCIAVRRLRGVSKACRKGCPYALVPPLFINSCYKVPSV